MIRPLVLSLAALTVLGISLGCGDALRPELRSDACGVALRLPMGMQATDDLLTQAEGALQASSMSARERYLTVQCLAYADYDSPWSALTALDAFTSEEEWEPIAGDPHAPGVHIRRVGGHDALGRYTWEVLDNGIRVVNWSGVVDLPDRRLFIEAWTLSDTPDLLDQLLLAVDEISVDLPSRAQEGRPFTGVNAVTAFAKPLDASREGVPLTLEVERSEEREEPPEGWEVVTFPGPLGDYTAWLARGTGPVLMLLAHPDTASERAAAWRDAGGTVLVPFPRGVNGNPGRVERLWGEVDDVLAARTWLETQPDVKTGPVVLAGGWAEGTLAALVATRTDAFDRVVVLASPVDVEDLHERFPRGYEPTEYAETPDAHRLRSPLLFTPHIQSPVLYVQGEQAFPLLGPYRMERAARRSGAPFELLEGSQTGTADLFAPVLAAIHARAAQGTVAIPLTLQERLDLALAALANAETRAETDLRDTLGKELATGFVDETELVQMAVEQGFEQLAGRGEILGGRVARELLAERRAAAESWDTPTDPERLDRAFSALEASGMVALHHYEDCADCAYARARHVVERREDGGASVDGFVYYSRKNTAAAVEGDGLYLGYDGWRVPTKAIGERVKTALETEGLTVRWSGDASDRIHVVMDYKRRPPT